MRLTDFFASRHVRWLELEIEVLREKHAAEIKTLRETMQGALDYAHKEAGRLQTEVDRLRNLVAPSLAPEKEESGPHAAQESFGGTPWQRILRRELDAQDAEANARYVVPASDSVSSTGTN